MNTQPDWIDLTKIPLPARLAWNDPKRLAFYLQATGRYRYEIAHDRLQTPEDLLQWIRHLADKNWFDRERLQQFLDHTMAHLGIER